MACGSVSSTAPRRLPLPRRGDHWRVVLDPALRRRPRRCCSAWSPATRSCRGCGSSSADLYVSPEQLMLVPLMLLGSAVPGAAARGRGRRSVAAAGLPEGRRGIARGGSPALADSWFAIGPAVVSLALRSGDPDSRWRPGSIVLALRRAAWRATSPGASSATACSNPIPLRELVTQLCGHRHRVDAILSPIAFVIDAARPSTEPLVLLAVRPARLAAAALLRDRAGALRRDARAAPRLPRHGDAALGRRRLRRRLHGPPLAARSSISSRPSPMSWELRRRTSRSELEFAAMLHDVGQDRDPEGDPSTSPARLTNEEFELVKTHTIEGQFMLDRVGGLLGRVGEIVRSCHERWDGEGYPDGLAGEEIPLAARIVFACDAYNAMTTDRSYRQRDDPTRRRSAELAANAGTQFDPDGRRRRSIKVVEEGEPEILVSCDQSSRRSASPGRRRDGVDQWPAGRRPACRRPVQ